MVRLVFDVSQLNNDVSHVKISVLDITVNRRIKPSIMNTRSPRKAEAALRPV
ncbi:MAG: hypothetical protein JO216_05595 [Hyphomicrobiales bacterium]|nr:hypothetical protein [Hyphomicrobiales bacterium]